MRGRGRQAYGGRGDMGRTRRRILVGVSIVVAAGVVVGLVTPYSRKHYTCLQCRLDQKVETYWGIARVTEMANACSRWYAGIDTGRVVGVEAVTDSVVELVKDLPYEDER
jgi:hypothetical protein